MRRLDKFFQASSSERLLFLTALAIVAVVRLGLTLTSYNALKRLVPEVTRPKPTDEAQVRAVAVAVSRSARLVPYASCLTQAVSGQLLLALLGFSSKIRIGVRQGPEGEIMAHAWLILDERTVLGGGLASYNVLTDLKSS